MDFQARIDQYKKDRKILFSYTEKIMVALMDYSLFDDLMPETFKEDPRAGYYELDAEQRVVIDTTLIECQITAKTLMMIQELRAKSDRQRSIPEAIQDCVVQCSKFFEQIKDGVLVAAKYPT